MYTGPRDGKVLSDHAHVFGGGGGGGGGEGLLFGDFNFDDRRNYGIYTSDQDGCGAVETLDNDCLAAELGPGAVDVWLECRGDQLGFTFDSRLCANVDARYEQMRYDRIILLPAGGGGGGWAAASIELVGTEATVAAGSGQELTVRATVHAANADCNPTRWPDSPRFVGQSGGLDGWAGPDLGPLRAACYLSARWRTGAGRQSWWRRWAGCGETGLARVSGSGSRKRIVD